MPGRKGDVIVSATTSIRSTAPASKLLTKLRPAFKKDGTVTAGNASGINDGAAILVLMSAENAAKRGLTPLARVASWATAGVDPAVMGSGPIPASRKPLWQKAGWKADDLDLIEANEAFAAQACAVNKDLGFDPAKVNVNGGAIALGHPIGASGARVLVTLLHEMQKRNSKKGLATLVHRRRHGHRPDRGALNGQNSRTKKQNNLTGRTRMGRVAVVTGGTRGIGEAISVGLEKERLQGRRELCRERCGGAGLQRRSMASRSYKFDAGDFNQCQGSPGKKVTAELGPIDIVVNNAGITRDGTLHKMTPQMWADVMAGQSRFLLQHVPLRHRQHARAQFRPHRQYRFDQRPGRAIRPSELRRGEIRHPRLHQGPGAGGCREEHHRQCHRARLYRHRHGARRAACRSWKRSSPRCPVGRLGRAEEIARGVLFLVADDAGFITGSTLSINGGQHMY